jgi:hypothetical protein
MTDFEMVREAYGGTPDMVEARLHAIHCERAIDALVRSRCAPSPPVRGGGDFIDFTREEDPDVND